MEKEKYKSAQSLLGILEDIQGGIILCNYDTSIQASEVVYINRGWTDITGYTVEQLKAEKNGNPQELVLAEDKPAVDAEYTQQLDQGDTYELMYRITHRSGEIRWVIDKGITRVLPGGKIQNKSIVTEVTRIKEREERMAFLAQTDQLTGLKNKATFTLLAQNALSQHSECIHALLIVDIDGFKSINDTCGHDFGDKVLAAVAERLKNTFRSSDIIGRVGGDEFMVLMTDVSNENAARKKTRELCAAVRDIQVLACEHIPITVSVGVSFFVAGKAYEAMFSEADAALYRAKDNGKDQYVLTE